MPFSRLVTFSNDRVPLLSTYVDDYFQHLVERIEQSIQKKLLPQVEAYSENADLEELGLTAITPAFLEAEQNKQGRNYTPENFYLNKSGTQFWGLMNELVAPRAISAEVIRRIESVLPDAPYLQQPILAVIAGGGGMGKSVMLRQIAHHFADEYRVWFLEREELEDFDFDSALEKLAERGETQLVCLDNWEPRLPFKFGKCQKEKYRNVKFVLTAREPESLNAFIFQGSQGVFNFDTLLKAEEKVADNLALISLALEKIPEWSIFLYSEKGKTAFAKAKPYHITFILNRLTDLQKTAADLPLTADFQALFENIIDADLAALQKQPGMGGFADALVDFAIIQMRFKMSLTKESFLRLADFHNKTSQEEKLFKNFIQKPLGENEWPCLPYYVGIHEKQPYNVASRQETLLTLNKDDLMEAIATVPQRTANLEKFEVRQQQVFEFLLDDESHYTSSLLLLKVAGNENHFSNQEKLTFIERLIKNGNTYYAYISLLFADKKTLDLPDAKRIELLEATVKINSNIESLMPALNKWLREKEHDKSKRAAFLAEIIGWGAKSARLFNALLDNLEGKTQKIKASQLIGESNSFRVVCRCLDILKQQDPSLAKEKASQLIEESKAPEVLRRCLNILNQQDPELAKDKASQLIDESKVPDILCRCLAILNQYDPELAKDKASQLIEESKAPEVLRRCLDILNQQDPELAKEKASQLIDESKVSDILCRCLAILNQYDPELAIDKASQLIEESKAPEVLRRCLDILNQQDLELAKDKASQLIEESKDHQVLCRCLDILNQQDPELAKDKASQLIEESKAPEVICRCLNILNQRDPDLAKVKACQLMEESTSLEVLHRCLNILGKMAESWALKKLETWEKELSPLIAQCLSIAFPNPKADQIINQIVNEPIYNFSRLWRTFMFPFFGNQAWEKRTAGILSGWKDSNPLLVNSCLLSYKNKPDITKPTCQDILENWEALVLKQKKYPKFFIWHLVRALAHPHLRELAIKTAAEMSTKGKEFCGEQLFEVARKIVEEGVFPGQTAGAEED